MLTFNKPRTAKGDAARMAQKFSGIRKFRVITLELHKVFLNSIDFSEKPKLAIPSYKKLSSGSNLLQRYAIM